MSGPTPSTWPLDQLAELRAFAGMIADDLRDINPYTESSADLLAALGYLAAKVQQLGTTADRVADWIDTDRRIADLDRLRRDRLDTAATIVTGVRHDQG